MNFLAPTSLHRCFPPPLLPYIYEPVDNGYCVVGALLYPELHHGIVCNQYAVAKSIRRNILIFMVIPIRHVGFANTQIQIYLNTN